MKKASTYFLILAKPKYTATQRFIAELKKLKIPYDIANYQHLKFTTIQDSFEILIKGESIKKYTHIIRKHVENEQELNLRYILSKYCETHNIRLLNAKFLLNIPYYNKLTQMAFFSDNNIPYLPSIYIPTGKYQEIENPFNYPVILKGHTGRVGKQVFLIKSSTEMNQFLKNNRQRRTYILQKFASIKEDFRLILVGGKVIGGWKRRAIETFKTTSGKNEKMLYNEPLSEEKSIAEEVSKLLEADYCAVDMMYLDGKPYVLEANLNAGFKVYEKKLKSPVNVAQEIIKHMLQ